MFFWRQADTQAHARPAPAGLLSSAVSSSRNYGDLLGYKSEQCDNHKGPSICFGP